MNRSIPKISIICPVYNVEKFLRKCIDSIIAQTFQDWELILVDDGSKDNSASICDEFANEDNRIRVIHKENGGVGTARQTGLDAVQGEYVIHVDSDDWVESTMLEELYKKAEATNADVVICDYYRNSSGKQIYCCQKTDNDPIATLKDIFNKRLYGALWNKLIRRSTLIKYQVRFYPQVNYCEDVLICAQILKHKEVVVSYVPKALYHYLMNETSISHNINREYYESLLIYMKALEVILPKEEYSKSIENVTLEVFINGFISKTLTILEIKSFFRRVRKTAFSSPVGIRWKIGYFMIDIGLYSIAHKLIKY